MVDNDTMSARMYTSVGRAAAPSWSDLDNFEEQFIDVESAFPMSSHDPSLASTSVFGVSAADGTKRGAGGGGGQRVKRPLNAFMVWSQIERRKMAAVEPGLHNSKISRLLGQRWQMMSDIDRLPYVREAQRLRQLHGVEHPDYKFQPRRKVTHKNEHCATVSTEVLCTNSHQEAPSVCRRLPFCQYGKESSQKSHLPVGAEGTKMVQCFRTVIGDRSSAGKSNFSYIESSTLNSSASRLPVKLTIDRSFKASLKPAAKRRKLSSLTSSNAATIDISSQHSSSRPCTPSDSYVQFSSQLQRSLVSTPGTDDSGWESTASNSASNFSMNSSILSSAVGNEEYGGDELYTATDVDAAAEATGGFRQTFEGIGNELLFVSSDGECKTLTDMSPDDEDNVSDTVIWELINLPSSWQNMVDENQSNTDVSFAAGAEDADGFGVISSVRSVSEEDFLAISDCRLLDFGANFLPEVSDLLTFATD